MYSARCSRPYNLHEQLGSDFNLNFATSTGAQAAQLMYKLLVFYNYTCTQDFQLSGRWRLSHSLMQSQQQSFLQESPLASAFPQCDSRRICESFGPTDFSLLKRLVCKVLFSLHTVLFYFILISYK